MNESSYVSSIIKAVKEVRGKAVKFVETPFSELGSPDIFLTIDGMLIVLETKVEGNKPSEIQKQRLDEWARAGAIALVPTTPLHPVGQLIYYLMSGDTKYHHKYRDFNSWQEWQDNFEKSMKWLTKNGFVATSGTSN